MEAGEITDQVFKKSTHHNSLVFALKYFNAIKVLLKPTRRDSLLISTQSIL